MLGGTRILDYGAYEHAYSDLRNAGLIAAAPDTQVQPASCFGEYSGAASQIGTCPYWEAHPAGQPFASAPTVDKAELPKQYMPLQYFAESLQSEQHDVAPASLAPRGLDPWSPQVPNPPPKILIAYV